MNKLQVIATEPPKPARSPSLSKVQERRLKAQATMDRHWLDKEDFLSSRSFISRWREDQAIKLAGDANGKKIVDLGCGVGHLVHRLRESEITGIELSQKAIALSNKLYGQLPIQHDYVPYTKLDDDTYDIVFALDLVGLMDNREYRLFFSELYRLMKPNGQVIFSSPVDIYSIDAKEKLLAMAEKDFVIEEIIEGHFCWAVTLMRWFPKWKLWIKGQPWLHRGGPSHVVIRASRRPLSST